MGTQTAAALLGDLTTAKLVNMVEASKKADVYSTIAKVVEKAVKTMPKKDCPELKEFYYKNKNSMFARDVFKRPTMTVLYGAEVQTFKDQLVEDLLEVTGDKLSSDASFKLATMTMKALEEVIPAPISLMRSLTGIVRKVVGIYNVPFEFTTATGSKFKAAKYKSKNYEKIGAAFGGNLKIKADTKVLNPGATAKSAAAQLIQSFDAAIAGEIQEEMDKLGIPCLSVFDSWSVPADKSDVLLKVARKAYVNKLSGNPLKTFYDEVLSNYPLLSEFPELFLEVGDYDIEKELKKAKLFIGL